jgi:hypothetical protein
MTVAICLLSNADAEHVNLASLKAGTPVGLRSVPAGGNASTLPVLSQLFVCVWGPEKKPLLAGIFEKPKLRDHTWVGKKASTFAAISLQSLAPLLGAERPPRKTTTVECNRDQAKALVRVTKTTGAQKIAALAEKSSKSKEVMHVETPANRAVGEVIHAAREEIFFGSLEDILHNPAGYLKDNSIAEQIESVLSGVMPATDAARYIEDLAAWDGPDLVRQVLAAAPRKALCPEVINLFADALFRRALIEFGNAMIALALKKPKLGNPRALAYRRLFESDVLRLRKKIAKEVALAKDDSEE